MKIHYRLVICELPYTYFVPGGNQRCSSIFVTSFVIQVDIMYTPKTSIVSFFYLSICIWNLHNGFTYRFKYCTYLLKNTQQVKLHIMDFIIFYLLEVSFNSSSFMASTQLTHISNLFSSIKLLQYCFLCTIIIVLVLCDFCSHVVLPLSSFSIHVAVVNIDTPTIVVISIHLISHIL